MKEFQSSVSCRFTYFDIGLLMCRKNINPTYEKSFDTVYQKWEHVG